MIKFNWAANPTSEGLALGPRASGVEKKARGLMEITAEWIVPLCHMSHMLQAGAAHYIFPISSWFKVDPLMHAMQ
jgi:hypothetical protein